MFEYFPRAATYNYASGKKSAYLIIWGAGMSSQKRDRNARTHRTVEVSREILLGRYIADTGATVRHAAANFGVSKSTVHMGVTI
jgi:hypothetical protein